MLVLTATYISGTGSHKTGQSAYVLDASDPTVATVNLRVIRRAPWDTGTGASAGVTDQYPWYEVYLNNIAIISTATVMFSLGKEINYANK